MFLKKSYTVRNVDTRMDVNTCTYTYFIAAAVPKQGTSTVYLNTATF